MNRWEREVVEAARSDRDLSPQLERAVASLELHEKQQGVREMHGKRVVVTQPGGPVVQAVVVDVQMSTDRIDVTTEKQFAETGQREYLDGRTSVRLVLEVTG